MNELSTNKNGVFGLVSSELDADPRIKSDHSKDAYQRDLKQFNDWRAGRIFNKRLVETYAAELQDAGVSPNTINRKLTAIRWFGRRLDDLALDTDYFNEEDSKLVSRNASRIATVRNVGRSNGEDVQAGRYVENSELSRIIDACLADKALTGWRDLALITVAYSTGMRRSELSGLEMADIIDDDGDMMTIRASGKGDKRRDLYLTNGGYDALKDWLDRRGEAPGFVFPRMKRGGVILYDDQLSGEAMRLILKRRIEMAELQKPFTWHDLRRSCISDLLEIADVSITQKIAGHVSATQTTSYDRRPKQAQQRAVRSLYVKYKKRT